MDIPLMHCLHCAATDDLIEDDGPIVVCRPCVRSIVQAAAAWYTDFELDEAIRQTRTWQSFGVESQTYSDPKPQSVADMLRQRYSRGDR
jgi:hypothetical protein